MVCFSLACETIPNANLVDGGMSTHLFDIYTHASTQPGGHGIPKSPVSALVRSNHVDADMWMSMRVHLRHNIRSVAQTEKWTVAHKY